MDEVIKKGEAGGPEGGRRATGATPARATYRPGSLPNFVLQVGQQNTWICPAYVLLHGALLSRVMPQTGSLAISSASFQPATGGFRHRLGTGGGGSSRVAPPNLVPVSYTHLRAHETVLDLVCRLL